MQHFAALHLGLRCLSKYSLRSQWLNIHVQLSIVAQDGKGKQDSCVWQDQTESPGLANSRYKPSWTVLFPYFTLVLRSKLLTSLRNLANPYLSVMQLIEIVPFRNKFVANRS